MSLHVTSTQAHLVAPPASRYARRGKDERVLFDSFTREYFLNRPNLQMVLLLIDGSIPPQPIDKEYAGWLTENKVPFVIIFTKVGGPRASMLAEGLGGTGLFIKLLTSYLVIIHLLLFFCMCACARAAAVASCAPGLRSWSDVRQSWPCTHVTCPPAAVAEP